MDEDQDSWEALCVLEGLDEDWAFVIDDIVHDTGDLSLALEICHDIDDYGIDPFYAESIGLMANELGLDLEECVAFFIACQSDEDLQVLEEWL